MREESDLDSYRRAVSSFDWVWSDEARLQTYKNDRKRTQDTVNISKGCNCLRFALFECLADQTGDLKHPVYELYTLEAELDLGATILLSFSGYYKQGGMLMRSFLELAFLSIYYADHREEYEKWKLGQGRSPPFHGKGENNVLNWIFAHTTLQNHPDLKDEVSKLYTELNRFVHTSAIDNLNLWKGRDNVPRFLPRTFRLWSDYLRRTYELTSISLLIIYFGRIGGYLRRDKSGMWRDIVTSLGKEALHRYGISSPKMGTLTQRPERITKHLIDIGEKASHFRGSEQSRNQFKL